MMIAMSQALSVVRTARNREIAQNLLRRIDLDFPIEKIDYEERIESGEFDDPEGYYWTRGNSSYRRGRKTRSFSHANTYRMERTWTRCI